MRLVGRCTSIAASDIDKQPIRLKVHESSRWAGFPESVLHVNFCFWLEYLSQEPVYGLCRGLPARSR